MKAASIPRPFSRLATTSVKVEAAGFKTDERSGIVLNVE